MSATPSGVNAALKYWSFLIESASAPSPGKRLLRLCVRVKTRHRRELLASSCFHTLTQSPTVSQRTVLKHEAFQTRFQSSFCIGVKNLQAPK